jgi:hypothetical protein
LISCQADGLPPIATAFDAGEAVCQAVRERPNGCQRITRADRSGSSS